MLEGRSRLDKDVRFSAHVDPTQLSGPLASPDLGLRFLDKE